MLSRTASSLYWLGRYVERADFIARLVEATVRLDALSARPAGEAAWASALSVTYTEEAYAAAHQTISQQPVAHFLTLDMSHPGSIVRCLEQARNNGRAVRTALTREAWTAINRLWLLFAKRVSPGGAASTLALVEGVMAEARGFEGAIHRMMGNEATMLIQLGAAIERADNTARLLDVKYHLLLPEGERVGGLVDRDQWTTILQTVSAVTAYRWLYSDGLRPSNVIDLLITRSELPRSLAGCVEEVVEQLNALAKRTGLQGEADRMARARIARMQKTRAHEVIVRGLHEYLQAFIRENALLDAAIARQFRFI
ncbi:alpha-E domain-containing protein [Sphingomonas sp. R647]|uniref:alpha-E domain-containing protein n=1 Tax=Sphingomonas sp. R647 TaxID=2875233 RepID=UPI001CD6E54E|nr:alpha-E domain-containing protein [Sphingomonas sp. R647]MCA1198864.1 alpha-E domain-containing protein [Sphingomonas sp. R647]